MKLPYDLPGAPVKSDAPKPDSYGVRTRGEDLAPQIRHTDPAVAKHCARVIIAQNMDTAAAVSKMLASSHPDATQAQIVALARLLMDSPHVQREIKNLLEEIGYGDQALKKLIGLLWVEVLGGNDKRWASAARLLAEITGAAKAASKDPKLPTLRLAGMDEGLSRMLGDAAPSNEESASVELDTMVEDDVTTENATEENDHVDEE